MMLLFVILLWRDLNNYERTCDTTIRNYLDNSDGLQGLNPIGL